METERCQNKDVNDIMSLDLSYVFERMTLKDKWPKSKAKQAIAQYRNFLILRRRYPKQKLIPSADIDEVWHTHMLFTKKYHSDCERLFEHFLHHSPEKATLTTSELKKIDDEFDKVQELYHTEFGDYIYAVRSNFLIERIHKILELLITKTLTLACLIRNRHNEPQHS